MLVLLLVIWIPEFRHFYIPNKEIPQNLIEEGRAHPSEAVLEEIRSHWTAARDWRDDAEVIGSAEKLLKGQAEVPGFAPIEVHLPFDPADLDKGVSVWQLQFAGLVVPEVLLDAYRLTSREEFYVLARDVMLAWARYERKAWVDRGFLWNDHAIADRARTIAEFWRIYRQRPDYSPEIAAEIWGFAARTAAFLAKADQYNFATNHGVMQNVALLHICIAFPSLPGVQEYEQTAILRLKDEMAFYVGPDGVVLEHSAEYDEYGLFLFGIALRDATLLHLRVPPDWAPKYEAAKNFYAEMRRSDGTLPTFGDTTIGHHAKSIPTADLDAHELAGPLTSREATAPILSVGFYPVAGYSILWDGLDDGRASSNSIQTVLSWSYFPGHGHKHADESSVLLWAWGHEWWTGAGYWPYDDAGRVHAECWEGSNAPHLANEECGKPRTSSLVSYGNSAGLFGAETERRGPGSLIISRLLIHASPLVWVTVDECSGIPGETLQTIWTTAPEVEIKPGTAQGAFDLAASDVPGELHAYFLGDPALAVKLVRGSHDPFAGWISERGKIAPTQALVAEQPSEKAWAITVWTWGRETSHSGFAADNPARVVRWNDRQNWSVAVPVATGTELISRSGDTITFVQAPDRKPSGTSQKLELGRPSPEVASQIAAIHGSYEAAGVRYPKFKELYAYRLKATILLLIILVGQELFLLLYSRIFGRHVVALRSLVLCGWLALAVWVPWFYLSAR